MKYTSPFHLLPTRNTHVLTADGLKRSDYHLRLYQNKPLLNFVEKGDVDFFNNEKNWEDFWDTPYRGYEAHQKAYRHLSQFIEKADVALDNMPPVESPKIKLHEELREYVDLYYANLMNLLIQRHRARVTYHAARSCSNRHQNPR